MAVFRNMGPRSADNLRKRITKCFDTLDLKTTIQSNLKIVNYLDVTFNLTNNSYYPYRKPDNPPMYINVHSNHPPSIIKQVPDAISKRISSLSCNIDELNKAAPLYNETLKKAGPTQLQKHKQSAAAKVQRSAIETQRSAIVAWATCLVL